MKLTQKDWNRINSVGIKKTCPICKSKPGKKCNSMKTKKEMVACHPQREHSTLDVVDKSSLPFNVDWRAFFYTLDMG